jgi:hypothetical protein
MEPLFLSLAGITILFFLFLILRNFSKKICAICLSVSLTWIVLLSLYFLGIFTDKIIIAILMGMSALGLFYMFYEKLSVFKLPFILTLIYLIYFILEEINLNASYFLLSLWIFFFLIYLFRKNRNFIRFVNKLIECCRNW